MSTEQATVQEVLPAAGPESYGLPPGSYTAQKLVQVSARVLRVLPADTCYHTSSNMPRLTIYT